MVEREFQTNLCNKKYFYREGNHRQAREIKMDHNIYQEENQRSSIDLLSFEQPKI